MSKNRRDLHVLVVDDNAALRQHLAEALALWGCCVFTASDGVEAMKTLENERVDLLITDYDMPRMNGLDLIQWSKVRLPQLIAVLITGHTSQELTAAGRRCGAWRVLLKPLSAQHFLSLLEEVRERV